MILVENNNGDNMIEIEFRNLIISRTHLAKILQKTPRAIDAEIKKGFFKCIKTKSGKQSSVYINCFDLAMGLVQDYQKRHPEEDNYKIVFTGEPVIVEELLTMKKNIKE